MTARRRARRWALAAALGGALTALVACTVAGPAPDPTLGGDDLAGFQKVYMSSYYAEQGGTGTPLGSRALAPFSRASSTSRATVPINASTSYVFSTLAASATPTTLAGYPEPGQTTKFTVTKRDAANNVYDVTATTTYPSTDIRKSYVEEYYIRDIGKNASGFFDVTTPDDAWTVDDPIVKLVSGSWVQDQTARVKQLLTFTDGTTRTETIVSQTDFTTGTPKFAAFDPDASLDFGQLFYPSTDTGAVFSSVVVYDVAPATNPNYWFWSGSNGQHILGIRYYTEFKDTAAGKYYAYTILFEKTLSTLTTQAGSFTQTLQTVFVGSQFDTLAESVLRQRTTYTLDGGGNPDMATGTRVTNMQTRVVNIAGRQDFFLQQLDSDYAKLSSWATSTIYTPTGSAAEVIATDPTAFLFNRTEITQTGGGATLPVVVTDTAGLGDLATLYTSLTEGAAVVSTTSATPPGSIQPSSVAWSFDGAQKGTVLNPNPAYDLSTTGTVETWVYVNQHVDTAGLVHKGVLPDFSDECFSLQFWGNGGQLAFVLDGPSATAYGGYDLLTSTINLNTKKWYYIVATWDVSGATKTAKLYINGALDRTITPSSAANGARVVPGAGLVVGSQLPAQYSALYGYFSLNGKLVGTKVSATVLSAAQIVTNYNAFLPNTTSW